MSGGHDSRRDGHPGGDGDEARPAGTGEAEGAEQDPTSIAASLDFFAFLQSLYVSALMALGEVENPETRRRETNLDLARQNIDILALLKDKTRGNLSDQESSFLTQVVTQLQLAFVEKRRGR